MKNFVILTLCSLLVVGVGVLVMATVKGRPIVIESNKQLEGVDTETEEILSYASLAPNSHNMQSWHITLYANEQIMRLTIDDDRTLPVADPLNREVYLSLGCYLETLTTAFQAFGYDTEVHIDLENKDVQVGYHKEVGNAADRDSLAMIKKRHTDKSAYQAADLASDLISDLLADLEGVAYYGQGSPGFAYLKTNTLKAITAQVDSQAYRDELNLWLRLSDKEAASSKDGISAEMIGLKGIVKTFYYWTTDHQNAQDDRFAAQGIKIAEDQVDHCSGFFVITGGSTIEDWIETGRRAQAFWLRCAKNDIAIQPMSAVLEVAPYNEDIQTALGLDEKVHLILRAGYVKAYGENIGLRRDLEEYITVVK